MQRGTQGPVSIKCMHMISRDRDHSEGRGVGVNGRLKPLRKLIRFGTLTSPLDWYTTRVFFKVCLVLIFLNTIVEKTYPEP